MQKAVLNKWVEKTQTCQNGQIPVLNGIRVLCVGLVAWFHLWQQSWLTPSVVAFGQFYSFDFVVRSGYIWVDGMLLLSGFLLFLPYAFAMEEGTSLPRIKPFYQKRFFRIAPSYYFCVLFVLFYKAIPSGAYTSVWACVRDVLAHFTFTHNLFPFSYYGSPLNGALWTLGVEMQFYLIFPLLARAFVKKPLLTYIGMAGAALLFREYAKSLPDTAMYFNQLPAFLDVYANGFLAACVFAALQKRLKEDGRTRIFFTVIAVMSVCLLFMVMRGQAAESGTENIRGGQMGRRFELSALLSVLILSCCYSLRGLRFVLGNRVTAFLAGISYQFYMWHQVFAVWMKEWGIPYSEFESPNVSGDKAWQFQYTWLWLGAMLLLAFALTYLLERPAARALKTKFGGKKK